MTELETKKNEIATRYGFKGWDGLMDGIFHNRTNIFRLNRYLFNSLIEDLMEKSLPNPSVEEIRERFFKDCKEQLCDIILASGESESNNTAMHVDRILRNGNKIFEWFKPFLRSYALPKNRDAKPRFYGG